MEITVGEMKAQLSEHSDDLALYFGGLEFNRLKQRGDKLLQVEFEQNVYPFEGKIVVDNLDENGNLVVENRDW